MTKRVILAIHRDQIETFGGTLGIRDADALDSALAQPQATFDRKLLHRTVEEQAAAYLFHIVQDHPFIDGNKRVGLAVMDTFLRLNGYRLAMTDRQLFSLVMRVASGKIDKKGLVEALRDHLEER